MSNKPNPVALTAAMLMRRACQVPYADERTLCDLFTAFEALDDGPAQYAEAVISWFNMRHPAPNAIAALASDLHRLTPACKRWAEALCDNPVACTAHQHYDESEHGDPMPDDPRVADWVRWFSRIDKRMAKLNEKLAPLALKAVRTGDPRGWTLRLQTTDPKRPVPRNGWDDESWGIG